MSFNFAINTSLKLKRTTLVCLLLSTLILNLIFAPMTGAVDGLAVVKPETVGMSSERLQRVTKRMQGIY